MLVLEGGCLGSVPEPVVSPLREEQVCVVHGDGHEGHRQCERLQVRQGSRFDDAPSSGVPWCAVRQSCGRARRRSCLGRHHQSAVPTQIALPGPGAATAARTPTRGQAAQTTSRAAGSAPGATAREREGPGEAQARGGGSVPQCPFAETAASQAARTAPAPAWRVSKSRAASGVTYQASHDRRRT